MTGEVVIRLEGVRKAFGRKVVLDGADLEVRRGETLVILGGSGTGKSVTLKHINGLIRPDAGRVVTLGHEVSALGERDLWPLRRRVSYLFQGGALFDSMTVFENVAFPLVEHGVLAGEALRRRVRELLDLVRLGPVERLLPSELSGGMQKRVALARALALEPELILYDEPTTGLDPVTGRAIAALILDLAGRTRVTSVVVTHDIPLTLRIADRIAFLQGGRFVFQGSVEAVRREGPQAVQEFLAAGGGDA